MQLTKWFCLVSLLLVMTGCVRVTENDHAANLAVNVDSRHDSASVPDLRVAAIELDSAATLRADNRLGLLVVIENRGLASEQNAVVRVVLLDDAGQVVLDGIEYAAPIPTQETAIVRFAGDLPGAIKSRYQLHVEVGSVAGEVNVSNNVRVYDVAISEP